MDHRINKFRGTRNSGTAESSHVSRTGFPPFHGPAFLRGLLFHMVVPEGLSFQKANWLLPSSPTCSQAESHSKEPGSGAAALENLLGFLLIQ